MKVHIYLIPYAGADVSCFGTLVDQINEKFGEQVKTTPVELSGHGKRRKEPLYENMEAAVSDILRQLPKDNEPVILYGHCIGGIIAYATYKKCLEMGMDNIHSVILGSSIINRANAEQFEGYINSYVEENIRMMFPQLPEGMILQLAEYKRNIVKQEFHIVNNYLVHNKIEMDERQLLVFGRDDKLVNPETIGEDYKEIVNVRKIVIPGGHFFLEESSSDVVCIIEEKIKEIQETLQKRGD